MVLRNRWDLSLQILIEPCRGDHCVKSNVVNNLCKDMVYTFVLQCNLINPKFKARSLTQKSFLYCVKAKIKIPPRRLYAASGGACFLMQHLHRRGDVTLAISLYGYRFNEIATPSARDDNVRDKPQFTVQILDSADCFATAHVRFAKCGMFTPLNKSCRDRRRDIGFAKSDCPCPLGLCRISLCNKDFYVFGYADSRGRLSLQSINYAHR